MLLNLTTILSNLSSILTNFCIILLILFTMLKVKYILSGKWLGVCNTFDLPFVFFITSNYEAVT